MSHDIYIGENNTSKLVTSIYVGVENIAKQVVAVYAGINNVAKKIFTRYYTVTIPIYENQYIEVECNGIKHTKTFKAKAGSSFTAAIYAHEGFTAGEISTAFGVINGDTIITATMAQPVVMDVEIEFKPKYWIEGSGDIPGDNYENYALSHLGEYDIVSYSGIMPTGFNISDIKFHCAFSIDVGSWFSYIELNKILPWINSVERYIAVQILVNEEPNYDDAIADNNLNPYYYWFTNAGVDVNGFRDIYYDSEGNIEIDTSSVVADTAIWFNHLKNAYNNNSTCKLRIRIHYLPGDAKINLKATATQDVTVTLDSGAKYKATAGSEYTFTAYSGQTYTTEVELNSDYYNNSFYTPSVVEPSTGTLLQGLNTITPKPVNSILSAHTLPIPDLIDWPAFDGSCMLCVRSNDRIYLRDREYLLRVDSSNTVTIAHSNLSVFNTSLWTNGISRHNNGLLVWGRNSIEYFNNLDTLSEITPVTEQDIAGGSLVKDTDLFRVGGEIYISQGIYDYVTYMGKLNHDGLTYSVIETAIRPRRDIFTGIFGQRSTIIAGGYHSDSPYASTAVEMMDRFGTIHVADSLNNANNSGFCTSQFVILGSPTNNPQVYDQDYTKTTLSLITAPDEQAYFDSQYYTTQEGYLVFTPYGIGLLDTTLARYRFIDTRFTAEDSSGNLLSFYKNDNHSSVVNSFNDEYGKKLYLNTRHNLMSIIDLTDINTLATWFVEYE